ncbi:serine/threonine-protein kinase [Streptomyces sp. HMX87]|uniref:serine/threonine-protein kinase n=1 Tax=Streptomyces sp. HMX87 TaxID=3390849 RepID=UPI003A883DD4
MKPLETGDPVRLGPYRLHGVLGEGGMGRVYTGQDAEGRIAAVKVLHPHLTHDRALVQRFVREAQTARAVTGTGVARVLDTRTEGGRPWIATEFLSGPTLEVAVRAYGPLEESAVRVLAAALADALSDIHAAGLIHRDLKPANVVLTSSGPRIIDFGIARPEHGLTLTTTGQVPVTPGYGAPEQVLGHRVGPAADVFSLGALLVYAASGQRAYEGTHVAAVQYEVVHGEARTDRVPPTLRTLIGPCLAKDPAHRPAPRAVAQAFAPPRGADRVWRKGPIAEDIKRREHQVRALATLPGTTAASASLPRRRVLAVLGAGAAVTAAGGGTAGWWFWKSRRGGSDPFGIPPAVDTPAARLLSAEKGDYVLDETPGPLWRHTSVLGDDSPAPLPVRDVLIVGDREAGVTARGVVDGKVRWSAPEAVAVRRYVSLSDRLVATVADDGSLLTFVAATGAPKWTSPADAASVLAADAEAVYVVTADGRLRSVGRSDATVRWTASADADLGGTGEARGLVARGVLVVTTAAGDVLGIDTRGGRTLWKLRDQAGNRPKVSVAGRSLFVSGRSFTARRLRDGKRLWSPDITGRDGQETFWGPSVVHGSHVYAAVLGSPLRFDAGDGKPSDWAYASLLTCDPLSPLVIQGNGFWSVAVNEEEGAVNVVHRADDQGSEVGSTRSNTSWTFRIIENVDKYWMTADGNRVFVVDGGSLTALPVF